VRSLLGFVVAVAACGTPPPVLPDAGTRVVAITAEVTSTRFVTREHMLAAAEMQISGEPFAEAMGRDLKSYSRVHLPTDLSFATTPAAVDLAGFSTAIESYEYSKQPMNELAFESGAGTALAVTPATIQHFAAGANTLGRFVFPPGTFPTNNPSGTVNPVGAGVGAENPLGWPGLWPTNHVFASFDPTIAPTSTALLECGITSDDDPGKAGALGCADYECDATTLHLPDRAAQADFTITPGADGFSGWKYGLWTINYLQVMHDANEAPVMENGFLGSSDIEGFQAQLFVAMLDARADDWLLRLSTADGTTLDGFGSLAAAVAYDYATPLRWFPGAIAVTETPAGTFPSPSYTLASPDSHLLDAAGLVLAYSEAFALTDARNPDVGGAQPALAVFDGDPFPADDGAADGEATLHDRALAMLRVAIIDLDRIHADPATGVLVDDVQLAAASPIRGATASTTTTAYALIALRTAARALSSQLELYSNNVPDTAAGTPLDALPLQFPAAPALTFGARVRELVASEAALLYDHLTDATGRAWIGWDIAAAAPVDDADQLDAYTAAIRGLFTAYLATGDTRFRDRAVVVYTRMDAVFYDPQARIYAATPAPAAAVAYTPLRFALLQSALRDVYELVAARPGGEALAPVLEQRIGRLNKLVLDGWDDRNDDGLIDWPSECATVDANFVPHGGLEMAERTLTGETGSLEETVMPGQARTPTFDRDWDCVPEIDDAHLPAALADAITFRIAQP